MIEVQVDAEITESRQVTITLPPDVPVGRMRLTVGIPMPPPATLPRLTAITVEPGPDGYKSGRVEVLWTSEKPE